MTGRPNQDGWARLHPLSPLIRIGRVLFVLLLALAPSALARGKGGPAWVELVALGAAVVGGVVFWLVTRWRLHGGELQIETGLLRHQSIRVPVSRIQAVDLVRPLLGRMLGLTEVRVVVAGHGANRTRLSLLPAAEAVEIRARLLALAHGLAAETPAPPERRIFTVRNGWLIGSVLLSPAALIFTGLLGVTIGIVAAGPKAAAPVLGGLGSVEFSLGALVLRRLLAEFGFTVAEAPDGLRVRAGLLQTRAETIPLPRVQGIRWSQPLLWRPFGWQRLEIDVARQRAAHRGNEQDGSTVSRALLPVGDTAAAHFLLGRTLPGAQVTPPPAARAPRRAALRAPLSYWRLFAWTDGLFIYAGIGRTRRTLAVVPLAKAQSVRWVQGPLQRRLRLATVHVDTAGRGWRAEARCRDEVESRALFDQLAAQARAARAPRLTPETAPP
ncbi:MAG TPA: PH domain-containing protein [Mycobacteriales bacterium]|nr:PH domain-containing protein [Mycobacteriales bacterium]